MDVMNIFWAEFVYAPLLLDKVQKIQESDSGLYGAGIASKVHAELRKLGGIRPPREFVFMDRAAIGLGSVFMHLKAEINWHQMFHGLIDDFDRTGPGRPASCRPLGERSLDYVAIKYAATPILLIACKRNARAKTAALLENIS